MAIRNIFKGDTLIGYSTSYETAEAIVNAQNALALVQHKKPIFRYEKAKLIDCQNLLEEIDTKVQVFVMLKNNRAVIINWEQAITSSGTRIKVMEDDPSTILVEFIVTARDAQGKTEEMWKKYLANMAKRIVKEHNPMKTVIRRKVTLFFEKEVEYNDSMDLYKQTDLFEKDVQLDLDNLGEGGNSDYKYECGVILED